MRPRQGDIHCLKVITLGPAGAGKTCLLMKATNEDYTCPLDYNCTIGVDFKVKMCIYGKTPVKLHIWDTAGQERFFQINRMYYRDVHAVLFIFDLSSAKSFESIDFYWKDFDDFAGAKGIQVYRVLVGNKCDISTQEVTTEQAQAWAQSHKVSYVSTSAKTGVNIPQLFDTLLTSVMANAAADPAPDRRLKPLRKPAKRRWPC
jgi:small GTP-binding protein